MRTETERALEKIGEGNSYPSDSLSPTWSHKTKRLALKGPRVTFVTTASISKSIQSQARSFVNFEIISDGSEEVENLETIDESFQLFNSKVSESLAKLIQRHNSSKYPPKFLVYDSLMLWALNIARQLDIDGAPFFTQSCVVNAIYYHAHQGEIKMPLEEGSLTSLPSIPSLGSNDLPSFLCDTGLYAALHALK